MNEIEIIPEQENIVVNVEGVKDYNLLTNKPSINNVELTGNKTLQELGIQPTGDYALKSEIPTKLTQLENDGNFVKDANYVHTDNNFTTGEKEKLASLENYDDSDVKADIEQNKKDIASNESEINSVKNSLQNYALVTETGNKISLTIDSDTYVMTLQLQDKNGNLLSTGSIDLPLETMVVGASYDDETKEIILTLKNGTTVSFSVADLVDGLVSQDTLNSTLQDYALKTSIPTKLNQLVEDSTHRLVTDTEKATWNNKVDKVSGKGLSTNDFTNELKSKLDGIEDNAQVNKIEKISLDGVEQEINEKEVNIKSYDINKYFYNALTYNNAKGNDLTFEDSIEFPLGKLDMDGKSEQDLSKMTYKCNGTEIGDYYFTYEDTNYQFTMPSVTSSSILVFDTSTLKLSINDEEITTSNSNTGTLIELSATPNPDYPQEINSIEGDLEYIGYGNKNLFDINDGYNFETVIANTVIGKWYKFLPNTQYTISTNMVSIEEEDGTVPDIGEPVNQNAFVFVFTDKNQSSVSSANNGLGTIRNKTKTITTNDEGDLFVGIRSQRKSYFPILVEKGGYIQLEEGSSATEYEPYKGHTLTIPTNGQVFRKVRDVADKLIVDMKTGDYYKQGNIGEKIFKSSDNWYKTSYGNNTYATKLSGIVLISNKIIIISNSFNGIKYDDRTLGNKNTIYYSIDTKEVVARETNLTSISEFNNWLNENNMIVNYQLETPTLEKIGTLTKEQLDNLVTFKGYNNVMINTNLGQADIDIEYVLDMKKYIDNKIAEISAQLI